MFRRIGFTLKKSFIYRQQLREIQRKATRREALDFSTWQAQGVRVIAFDFDGVLAADGKSEPDAWGLKLLQQACKHFRVCILSNKPTSARAAFFKHCELDIEWIHAARKKPYPDGLESIVQHYQVQPSDVMLVEDRLLTGGLACTQTGCRCQLILNPVTDFKARPLQEAGFSLLRSLERVLF